MPNFVWTMNVLINYLVNEFFSYCFNMQYVISLYSGPRLPSPSRIIFYIHLITGSFSSHRSLLSRTGFPVPHRFAIVLVSIPFIAGMGRFGLPNDFSCKAGSDKFIELCRRGFDLRPVGSSLIHLVVKFMDGSNIYLV